MWSLVSFVEKLPLLGFLVTKDCMRRIWSTVADLIVTRNSPVIWLMAVLELELVFVFVWVLVLTLVLTPALLCEMEKLEFSSSFVCKLLAVRALLALLLLFKSPNVEIDSVAFDRLTMLPSE